MNEFDEEARRQRGKEKAGTNYSVCLGCGFSGEPWHFEFHHIAGRNFDKKLGFSFELRCHRNFTHEQNKLPKPSSKSPLLQEIVAHLCIGIAIAAEPIAETIDDWGRQLISFARRRKLPEDSVPLIVARGLEWLARFLRAIAEPLKRYGLQLLGQIADTDAAEGVAT
jgi:hypothetical protein